MKRNVFRATASAALAAMMLSSCSSLTLHPSPTPNGTPSESPSATDSPTAEETPSGDHPLIGTAAEVVKAPFATEMTTGFSPSGTGWFSMDAGGPYGLIGADGVVIEAPFATAYNNFADNDVTWYQPEGSALYGIIDSDGTIVREPFSEHGTSFNNDGTALTQTQSETGDLFMLVDEKGDTVREPFAAEYDSFRDGPLMYRPEGSSLYAMADNQGKELHEPFAYALVAANIPDVFWYQSEADGLWGLVDSTGKILHEPFAYDDGNTFNKTDSTDTEPNGLFNDAGYASFQTERYGLFGIVNSEGKIVTEPFAGYIWAISPNGAAWYTTGDYITGFMDAKWGIAAPSGEILIDQASEQASDFYGDFSVHGVSWYFPDGMPSPDAPSMRGLVNDQGEVIADRISWSSRPFSRNGVAWYRAEDGGLYGLLNDRGEVVKEPFAFYGGGNNFDDNGYSWYQAEEGGPWGLISDSGKIVRDPFVPSVDEPAPFDEYGVAWYCTADDLCGLVNKRGDILMEPFAAGVGGPTNSSGVVVYQSAGLYGIVRVTLEKE